MTQREKRINDNLGLVHSCAQRFKNRGVEYEDLFQAGCVGLIKAADGFDETLGYVFSTYAVPKISGEIRRFLRDDGAIKVSRTIKEKALKIKHIADKLQFALNREPTLSEISEASGFTVEEIAEQLNVKVNTIKCYITPKGQEKLSKFKNGRVFVPIHYDEDEDEYYGENGRQQREAKERSH